MRTAFVASFALVLTVLVGCGGPATPEGVNETCRSSHVCVNGDCECTNPGMENTVCNESTCEDDCRLCE
jgi:hypothetical protein